MLAINNSVINFNISSIYIMLARLVPSLTLYDTLIVYENYFRGRALKFVCVWRYDHLEAIINLNVHQTVNNCLLCSLHH